MSDHDGGDYEVGYRKPPKSTRFQKGQSGNRKGRPPGRHRSLPHELVLGRMVTIREDGIERRVTAEQAFLLVLAKKALEKGGPLARLAREVLQEQRELQFYRDKPIPVFTIIPLAPYSINNTLRTLRIAVKQDRYRDTAFMALEPWIVQAALARLGEKRLTLEQQRLVLKATRTPHKVKWPDWWEAK